jgi:hypothetical protein
MPELTNREVGKLDQRRNTAGADHDAPAVALPVMLGQGQHVTIDDKRYEVAAIPISRLREVGEIVDRCPEVLIFHALAAIRLPDFDEAATAELFNRFSKRIRRAGPETEDEAETPALTADDIAESLALGLFNLAESETEAMIELVVALLRRKHPNISAEHFAESLDVPAFLEVVRMAFRANPNLATRFLRLSPTGA